jgi:glycosyltransferase involved in cell wall biosynthesis
MSAPVLQVITSTNRRGAEIFATDLGEALQVRGREVSTVALAPGTSEDPLPVPTLGRHSLGASTLQALRRRIKATPLVVSHGSRSLPACAVASYGTGRQFVYRTIHDGVSFAHAPTRRARVALYLRRASAVVALWPGTADLFMRRYGVPASKIHTIANAAPAARFPIVDAERRRAARVSLGVAPDERVILYLGWLAPEKFPADTIGACAAVGDVRLVIAGEGPDRALLEQAAREVAAARVQFLGVVRHPAEALAIADVVLLPALAEGMPAVLIEAGLSGLPVVATDVGAVREVILDGDTGLLVPPGNRVAMTSALRDVLAAPAALGRRAHEHCVANFEIGVVAAAWDDLLGELEDA